jgi:hypothetical protein
MIGDAQPQVVLRRAAVAGVVTAQGRDDLAPVGGGGVRDRVEAHERVIGVAGRERGPRRELAAVAIDLGHARADDGDLRSMLEHLERALQAPGL